MLLFRGRAREARAVVSASSSFVCRNLWIGAERPGPFRLSVPNAHRHDLFRRFSRFDPFFDCLDRIKGVRAIASAAMVHPGSHEEAIEVPHAGRASHKIENAVVVNDATKRRNRRVTPTVVLQQFSATAKEISQIRIGGPGYAVIDTVRQCHPGIEIERHVVPPRILEYRLSEVRGGVSLSDLRRVRPHPTRVGTPAHFTTRKHPWKDLFPGSRIYSGTVERPDDSYLRSGQAVWSVFTLALQNLRIEVTKPRILQ